MMLYEVRQAKMFASFLMVVGAIIVSIPILIVTGPFLEARAFPVVKNTTFTKIKQTDFEDSETVALEVQGEKVRTCKFLEVRSLVFNKGQWQIGDIQLGSQTSVITRPRGVQAFGTWVIRPNGTAIKFEAVHRCHALWDTVTSMGKWEQN